MQARGQLPAEQQVALAHPGDSPAEAATKGPGENTALKRNHPRAVHIPAQAPATAPRMLPPDARTRTRSFFLWGGAKNFIQGVKKKIRGVKKTLPRG